MNKKCIFQLFLIGFTLIFLISCGSNEVQNSNQVIVVGEMKNVMRKGELQASIALDTISDKSNLYGLGPLEYLRGEILILDGKAYQSLVSSDSTMIVEETYNIKAPFFGYATIPEWNEVKLPEHIQNITDLELYLDEITKSSPRPFFFKLEGTVDTASIHIVNLPEGSKVSSPQEAHQGMVNYELEDEEVVIVGFFSTEHQTIFTHHDTYVHLHLITADRKQMGHLDAVSFKKGTMTLYLPNNK